MSSKLSIEEAARIAERAFLPLDCVAEVQDFRNRLGFRIYDPDNVPLLTVKDLTAPQVTDPKRLQAILLESRERVEKQGHALSPWSFPE